MPETMSLERRKVLRVLGANLVLTPGPQGMAGAISKAEEMVASDPARYVLLQQFKNPPTPKSISAPRVRKSGKTRMAPSTSWFRALAPEAPSPASRAISRRKEARGLFRSASRPAASPVIAQHLAGQPLKPGPHKIQGIGAGFIPETLDLSVVDRVEPATNEEAFEMARRLSIEEGILAGISGGAAVAVAVRLGMQPEFAGKTMVVVLPDAAERYLSTALFEGMFDE